MSAWAVAVGVAAAAMLLITAAAQLRRWRWASWLKSRDVCALIPTWTFFAPNPGVTDTRVLWREQSIDGAIGPWHEIVPPRLGLARAIWNPSKRARKAITDCGPMVVRLVVRDRASQLPMLSLPYLMLVQHVCSLPGAELGVARQFTVVDTTGEDEDDGLLRLLFVSRWHRRPGVPDELALAVTGLPELPEPATEPGAAEPV